MKEPNFAFQKILGINEAMCHDPKFISDMICRLLYMIKETNQERKTTCEFFRLDFRPPSLAGNEVLPLGSLVLDLKFGSKSELESLKGESK